MKTSRTKHRRLFFQTLLGFGVLSLAFAGLTGLASKLTEAVPVDNFREEVNLRILTGREEAESLDLAARNIDEIGYFEKVLAAIDREGSNLEPAARWELARVAIEQSRFFGIDPFLTLSIIKAESNFDRFAVSPAGALGLMQLRPPTARAMAYELDEKWNGSDDLFDIRTNVRLGLYYFNQLQRYYKRVDYALVAYNYGPTVMDSALAAGLVIPTGYADRIFIDYRLRLRSNT